MVPLELIVAHTWDGAPAAPGERARVTVIAETDGSPIRLDIDAPFHGDPAPAAPVGPTDALWEHEVVEVFLLGADDRYTEVELGPHGHHLVLRLEGRRNVVDRLHPLDFTASVDGSRWRGTARLPRHLLPAGPILVNAYAIHGVGPARRHLAMTPVPGPAPDFHRLAAFTRGLPL